MQNMVKYGLFDESEEEMFRKCVVFYSAIGAEQPPKRFELDCIGKVPSQQIKRDLDPVLRKGERFDLELVQQEVREYLASILKPTKEEELFWKAFSEGEYHPDWIFGESNELVNIAKHPMALWKCEKIRSIKQITKAGQCTIVRIAKRSYNFTVLIIFKAQKR